MDHRILNFISLIITVICFLVLSTESNAERYENYAECGVVAPRKRIYKRVVHGEKETEGQWPWLVSLQNPYLRQLHTAYTPGYMDWSGVGDNAHICGGTLIAPQWVITAKHCVVFPEGSNPNFVYAADNLIQTNWSAVVGEYDLRKKDKEEVSITVDRVIAPDLYTVPDIDYMDLALLHLSKPVEFSESRRLACLPDNKTVNSRTECIVAGWGTHFNMPDTRVTPITQYGKVDVITFDQCREMVKAMWDTNEDIVENRPGIICTVGTPRKLESPCRGDSGGPLVCKNSRAKWELIGIISAGFGCTGKSPTLFTDVRYYQAYIKKIINGE